MALSFTYLEMWMLISGTFRLVYDQFVCYLCSNRADKNTWSHLVFIMATLNDATPWLTLA